jgi:hypothetical protein
MVCDFGQSDLLCERIVLLHTTNESCLVPLLMEWKPNFRMKLTYHFMHQAAKRAEIDAQSVSLVRKFDKKKKKLQRQLDEENMKEDEAISKLKELQKENVALNDDLLELQLRQMDADDR